MKQHFLFVDRMKGLAIVMVVFGHFIIFGLGLKDVVVAVKGAVNMPLFMFLSGFVVSGIPTLKKTTRNVVALMIPFFIVGYLYMLFVGRPYDEFIHSEYKEGYWYLFVLAVFYVLMLPMKWIKYAAVQFAFALLVLVGMHVVYKNASEGINALLCMKMIRLYWPFFVLGFFCRKYHVWEWIAAHNWTFTAGLVIFVAGIVLLLGGCGHCYYPMAVAFIVFVLYLFVRREKEDSIVERQMAFLGRHSLDIYIFHYFFIQMTHLDELGQWLSDTGNVLIEITLSVGYAVAVAYLAAGVGMVLRKSSLFNDVVYGGFAKRFLK